MELSKTPQGKRKIRERSLFMAGVAPKRKGLGKQNFE
jgi:hypothetical protein